jgi:hypothetical protein
MATGSEESRGAVSSERSQPTVRDMLMRLNRKKAARLAAFSTLVIVAVVASYLMLLRHPGIDDLLNREFDEAQLEAEILGDIRPKPSLL